MPKLEQEEFYIAVKALIKIIASCKSCRKKFLESINDDNNKILSQFKIEDMHGVIEKICPKCESRMVKDNTDSEWICYEHPFHPTIPIKD